jgi:hypothetical protein
VQFISSTSSRAMFHDAGLKPVSRSLILLNFKLNLNLSFWFLSSFLSSKLSCHGFRHPNIASVKDSESKPNGSHLCKAFSIVSLIECLSIFVPIRNDSS